jgi:hypothetical protein
LHRAWTWRWGALVALLALSACHRQRYFVVKVDVSSALWPHEAGKADDAALRALLSAKLGAVPSLRQVPPAEVPKEAPRYELSFTPALVGTPADGGAVVAALMLRREQGGLAARYSVSGQARFVPSDGTAKLTAALGLATARAVDTARLQMAALEATDATLHKDLHAQDPRVRSFALARLAQAHDPAAIPGLREELKSEDADVVRRAMGGLVTLSDEGAVPALIDAAHGRPPEFQREVIYALGEIGGANARGYLYTVSQGADLEPLRVAAQEALHELEARPPAAPLPSKEKPQ